MPTSPIATAPVDHDEAIRFALGQRQVAPPDPLVKRRALLVDARFRLPHPLIPPFRAREAGLEIDIDQDGDIRLQTPARDAIEIAAPRRDRGRGRIPDRPASNR